MSKSELGLVLVKSRWRDADETAREQILLEMKQRGLSITDAIIALTMSKFYTLGEAKAYVSSSSAWHVEAENGKVLHEIAWQALEDFCATSPHMSYSVTET
ncbi:hypothetical protein GJ699_05410 [Duganella sp. FT80W]|uniref:Uncharacterized protein n=1 Tax=Duganella guangzhouensis TaxID=2666084 RepID=A0A6I2KYB0_9BURK|nr:hypothetical protein [Duganella guangzhouensis]MRW89414.1 hypothetical protein [Duganella guangzhouensis]